MIGKIGAFILSSFLVIAPQQTLPVEVGQPNQLEVKAIDLWLDRLEKNENCPFDGIIDSNGKKSYGAFCFQEATYLLFVKKYNLMPYAEEYELLNNLSDYDTQRQLAKLMIQDGGWRHWHTSVTKKIGMPPI